MTVVKSTKKGRLHAALEQREGVDAITPYAGQSSANAVAALDMQPIEVDQEMEDVNPVTSSFSMEEMAPGAERASLPFAMYLKGRGDATLSRANVPDIGDKLRAAGMINRGAPMLEADTGETIESHAFVPGETVTGGTSGATGVVLFGEAVGGDKLFVFPESGAFQAGETVTGGTSNATLVVDGDIKRTLAQEYKPTSRESVAMTYTGGVTGTFQPGETVVGSTSGAFGVLIDVPANNIMAIEPALGGFEQGETVTGTRSGATLTLASGDTPAIVIPLEAPSMTYLQNVDGIVTGIKGARNTFVLPLEAGKVMQAKFTARGQLQPWGDFQIDNTVTQLGADTSTRLQMSAAYVLLDKKRLPLQQLEIDYGNELDWNEDANGVGGIGAAKIFGRNPKININPNQTPYGVLDWNAYRRNSTKFSILASIGTAVGNRVAIYAPRCQVEQKSNQDDGGKWRAQVTAIPLQNTPIGDDELFIFFA